MNSELATRGLYYIAGPSGLLSAMTTLLHCLGVYDDIKTEEFGDYKLSQGKDMTVTNQSAQSGSRKTRL